MWNRDRGYYQFFIYCFTYIIASLLKKRYEKIKKITDAVAVYLQFRFSVYVAVPVCFLLVAVVIRLLLLCCCMSSFCSCYCAVISVRAVEKN